MKRRTPIHVAQPIRRVRAALPFAGLATLLGSVLPGMARAQCVMCGKNAEFAADGEPGRAYATLAVAAGVLLIPVLSMLAGFAAYVWKHRHSP